MINESPGSQGKSLSRDTRQKLEGEITDECSYFSMACQVWFLIQPGFIFSGVTCCVVIPRSKVKQGHNYNMNAKIKWYIKAEIFSDKLGVACRHPIVREIECRTNLSSVRGNIKQQILRYLKAQKIGKLKSFFSRYDP